LFFNLNPNIVMSDEYREYLKSGHANVDEDITSETSSISGNDVETNDTSEISV
jgi:hypothetical protein